MAEDGKLYTIDGETDYVNIQEFREKIDDEDVEFTEDDFNLINALDGGEEAGVGWCKIKRVQ